MTSEYERFRRVLPAAATFSKDPRAFWGDEVCEPSFLVSGQGSYVYDVNGKAYVDWICALGANILGYDYEGFNGAVAGQLHKGASFSLPTRLEYEVAEKLVAILSSHVPGWNLYNLQVRFTKTGTECTTAAVRLARAVTGRDTILRCSDSYLGWGDWAIATTPPHLGVPVSYTQDTVLFGFGQDPDTALDNADCFDDVACVILEQGVIDPPVGWYDKLRQWCTKNGTLLILDETASGFRYGLGGAAEYFGIKPDIATYGKALGNGVAISALVAPRECMSWFAKKSPIFVSGTFCGETLGLAAANYVLDTLTEKNMKKLIQTGTTLKERLSAVLKDTSYKVVGHGPRFIIQWPSDAYHAFFVREMAKRSVLVNRPFYTTLSHAYEEVVFTENAARDVISTLRNVNVETLYTPEQLPRVLFRSR